MLVVRTVADTTAPARGPANEDGAFGYVVGGTLAVEPGRYRVATVRFTLGRGREIRIEPKAVAVAVVAAGTMALTAGQPAWVRRGPADEIGERQTAIIWEGGGVLIPAGGASTFRNAGDGPLALWILTIVPDGGAPPATPAAAVW